MSNYDLKLSTTQPNHVEFMEFRQDDILSRTLNVAITSHDLPRDLTGYDVFLNSTLPSRNIARDKVTNFIDKVNGKFSYTLIDSFVQDTGRVATWFSIEKGGSTTQVGEVIDSTTNFTFSVVPGYRNCVKQGNYIWEFEELLRYVTGLANQSQVQLDKLKNDVTGIQKQIDDMFALIASQGVLTADEVRQLLINFMSGEDIELTVMSDFNGKVEGSVVENANIFKRNSSPILQLPSSLSWTENTQAHYDAIKKTDGTVATFSYATEGAVAAGLKSWDVLWILEQNFPSIFRGSTTTEEKVTIAKRIITGNVLSVWGLGSGPGGNSLKLSVLNSAGTWSTGIMGNTTNQIRAISTNLLDVNRITFDGKLHLMVNAEASDGTTASSVSIDYANITLTVKFNISDFVATKAQYDALKEVVDDHVADTVKHITEEERTNWNSKQDAIEKTPWTTGATAGVSHDGNKPLQYRKKGSKGQLRGGGMFPTNAGTTFLALPAFLWPPEGPSVYCEAIVRDSDYTRKCIIEIQPSGACKIITNTYSGNPCFFDRVEWDLD